MHITHRKAHNPSFAASIALGAEAELGADENETDAFDAWGSDLMDVHADADDWSAFRSTPSSSSAAAIAKRLATDRPGFDPPKLSAVGGDDDAWADMNDSSTMDSRLAEFDTQATYLTLHLSPNTTNTTATKPSSNRKPISPMSTPRSFSPQLTPPILSNLSSPPVLHEPISGMSEEDKAAEMARRKEERRLWGCTAEGAEESSGGEDLI